MQKSFVIVPDKEKSAYGLFVIRIFLGLVFFVFSWGESPSAASEVEKKTIKLAFYEYGYLYNDGAGIDKDVVDELRIRSGREFFFSVMARARIWADLASGNLDMSVSGIQTPERDKFAWFAPYLSIKNYAVVHSSVSSSVKSANGFIARPGLQMGVVASFKHGTAQDEWISILRQAGRVQESPDAETVFMKLKDQRVDAMFSQPPVYRKYLSTLNMVEKVTIQDWTPSEKGVPHGLIISKHNFSEKEADKFREIIAGMKNDGTLRKIFIKYLPESEADRMLEF